MWQPARQSNSQYHGQGIGLAVSGNFKQLLNYSYNSALWTTIIDPKVTLDFFTSQKDVVLIQTLNTEPLQITTELPGRTSAFRIAE
ncbi:hypothetical protein O5281_26500, partial [Escherichia coli]|nr:hypothetical protein [Escherichia coli]